MRAQRLTVFRTRPHQPPRHTPDQPSGYPVTANPRGKLLADAARIRGTCRPFDVGVGLLSLGQDREAQF